MLEKLSITKDNTSIFSIDIVGFCTSVKFSHIELAIFCFIKSKIIHHSTKIQENRLLESLKAGMKKIIVSFNDKCYEHSNGNNEDPVLLIGSFQSAFAADLVAAF